MRIFYIYRSVAHYRGMERIFVDKINYLVQLFDYDVWLVTADQGNHPLSYTLNNKAHHVDLKIRFHSASNHKLLRRILEKVRLQFLFVKRLKSLIKQQNPDVLVCNTDVFTNLVIMTKGRIPLVVESHSICRQTGKKEGDGFHRKLLRWYTFWNYRHADALVALTEADAKEWSQFNKRVFTIANVVHQNVLGKVSPLSEKRVIFASRFSQQKGIPFLLDIWKIVYKHHPDWHLDIYAQGELRDFYLPIIEALNINIHVHAATDKIFDCYCNSSIFILTSIYEPFGLVLPEAMSCGLPVVSFDCDFGPREIITDGIDGFLIPLGNIEMFAEKICLLIENQELREKLGKAGILSSKRYSPKIIMPLWKALFEKMLL